MRKDFFDYLLKLMSENEKIYIIFMGLGYPRYEEFKKKYPSRVINSEASEQTALDIAVGLSMSGKIVFTYTITPFYWRAAETIRYYVTHEHIPVMMCGAGRDDDYSKEDGYSHDARDIGPLMKLLKIKTYWPNTKEEMESAVIDMVKSKSSSFLSLRR